MNTLITFLRSKIALGIIIGLFGVALLTGTFSAGMALGIHKAGFSHVWGDNYSRNFGGPRNGLIEAHSTSGRILSRNGSTLVISGRDGAEKIVHVTDATVIRLFHDVIPVTALNINDAIVVIGSPSSTGQIDATLIRVLPSPAGMMLR